MNCYYKSLIICQHVRGQRTSSISYIEKCTNIINETDLWHVLGQQINWKPFPKFRNRLVLTRPHKPGNKNILRIICVDAVFKMNSKNLNWFVSKKKLKCHANGSKINDQFTPFLRGINIIIKKAIRR